MSSKSKLDRLKHQREELRKSIPILIQRGKFIQANTAMAKVKQLDEEIEEAEAYVPRALAELFDRKTLNESGINIAIIKVHLAADFLADCAYDLKDKFKALGVEEQKLLPMLDEIKEKSQAFASIVCHPEFAGLSDFIVTDEEFIDSMHEITQNYIDEHLTITDDEN